MIIKEQRGEKCPEGHPISVGDLSCEECDHFKFKTTDRVSRGVFGHPFRDTLGKPIMQTDEFCELLVEDDELG